ncbi:MAG: dienelactone hydrolase family protein [Burkholderiaceae bacterium]
MPALDSAMIETSATITTRDGQMPTWIVHPDEGGPFALVIFYMDALGIRDELRDMCRRIASVGYCVYLPNLYYRAGGPSFDAASLAWGQQDPAMVVLNDGLSMAMTVSDGAALLDHARHNTALRMPAAAIGYCMGGRHALAAAAAYPALIKAMASLHGGRLVTDGDDSPHRLIAGIGAEAYFGWAHDDPVAPASHAKTVEAALAARGLPYRLEWHAGAHHGFTFPERFCYHKQAAECVWSRLFDLFRRTLDAVPSR